MIDIEISGANELKLKLQGMGEKIRNALSTGMTTAMQDLAAYVKGSKLSGQVLKRRSGNLSSNINPLTIVTSNQVIGSVGTNVFYAKYHEFGGTFDVPGYFRRPRKGTSGKRMGVGGTDAIEVLPHTVTFPERSFLRSSLADTQSQIISTLSAAVKGATT